MLKKVFFILLVAGGGVAFMLPALLALDSPLLALAVGIVALAAYLVLAELVFRLAYRMRTGRAVDKSPKVPFSKMHIEPHPYMPYVYKRGFSPSADGSFNRESPYPLHKGRYEMLVPVFNNFRLINGPDGRRDVVVPKPDGRCRILCLGGSTTGNYIVEGGNIYSYPDQLERELRRRHPERDIEVVNGGMGGRTSAELLIHFLLSLVDTEPDAVVIYHAYNDLGPSLTSGFQADYSHARKNLGEAYNSLRIRSKLPYLPFALYHYILNTIFPGNLSNSILDVITVRQPDLEGEFQGTETYKRNLRHVIQICKARGIKVLCATYCQHLYPEIADSPVHRKYREGLALENKALEELAAEEEVDFIDSAAMMPPDVEYYVDSVHFSPMGMKTLAGFLSDKLSATLWRRED